MSAKLSAIVPTQNEHATILQVGDSKLDFNHPEGAFSIWWQSGGRNVRLWPP